MHFLCNDFGLIFSTTIQIDADQGVQTGIISCLHLRRVEIVRIIPNSRSVQSKISLPFWMPLFMIPRKQIVLLVSGVYFIFSFENANRIDLYLINKFFSTFTATNGTFCGNKIVEDGEECDCGYNYEECMEKCCYPRQVTEKDRLENPNAQGCRRKPGYRCSPSEGPCCDGRTCSFVPAHYSQMCKQETECSLNSSCNGTTPHCPNPTSKPDIFTACNDGTQVHISKTIIISGFTAVLLSCAPYFVSTAPECIKLTLACL